MRKLLVWAVLLLLLAGLTGCGKNKEEQAQASSSKDYVYKAEAFEIRKERQSVSQIFKVEDRIYTYGNEWSEDGEESFAIIYELDTKGNVLAEHRITQDSELNQSLNPFGFDSEGNMYAVRNVYSVIDEEAGEYSDDYYLVKMTLEGEELFSVKINDIPEVKALIDANDYFYYSTVEMSEGKGLYFLAMGNIIQFDPDGNFVKLTELDASSGLDNSSLVKLDNGEFAAIIYGETGMTAATIDLETGRIGEKYSIPGASYQYSYYGGKGYDLYMVDSTGLSGYNLGDEDKTQLMNYVDSDLNIYNVYNLVCISETEFIAMYDDESTGDVQIARFTKVDPADVKDKKTITLAMGTSDWEVRSRVVEFNKNSDEYRIKLMDYSALYGTDEDYSAGLTRLNTDIASGNVPDIILVDNSMPADSYISKGLFEDLMPYIESDSEIDFDDLSPNIVEAYSVDGKLYSLVPSYNVQSMVAKTSDVGPDPGWTVQEAMELLASKPEGTQLLAETTRDYILEYCMDVAADQFIDWDTGKCSFDSEAFIQMLEFVNTFPEEVDDSVYDDPSYWDNYDSMWREGKVIAQTVTLNTFSGFNYLEKGSFGEDITIIGVPSENGDGSAIYSSLRLAMSSKSKNKEGVWEFMRYFLTDEYQNEITYGFPVSLKRMAVLEKEATQKPYYEDENGNRVEYDDTYYVGGIEITIDPMTAEEAKEYKDQILSVTNCYRENSDLINIIKEEAAPYFAGQKNAEDVARIIQGRAQIYVNEKR